LWKNKHAPKDRAVEISPKGNFVVGADWKTNVNTGEHLAYIGEIPPKIVTKTSSIVDSTVGCVVDRNAKDVTRAVGLQGLFQGRHLALMTGYVVVDVVNSREGFKISLGLLNGLQDEGGLVAFRVVKPKSGCDL